MSGANGGDASAGRLQQAQQQVGEVVDIMRVNVEKVRNYFHISSGVINFKETLNW